jgi:hypothetical protein
MQTSYPIFESNQVLLSNHLNEVVNYLEQQDRMTRSRLIGIGIVCGLDVSNEPQTNRIRISRGCAVTSEGRLLFQEEMLFGFYRDYTLPVPDQKVVDTGLVDTSKYNYFHNGRGVQIKMWELLPINYQPGQGEPAPTAISSGFPDDKVVLLYLEAHPESLRNCDISDCENKGIRMNLTLRNLLIKKNDAKNILNKELAIANRPVNLSEHPRYGLYKVNVEKVTPFSDSIDTLTELLGKMVDTAEKNFSQVFKMLKKSYDAYKYLLSDLYSSQKFPNGPFGNPGYQANVTAQFKQNIFSFQYFNEFTGDLIQSYNEFIEAAFRLEAECCPNPGRFPLHILLGEVAEGPKAFQVSFNNAKAAAKFDPGSADSDMGPKTRPLAYRHYFIPSMLFDRQHKRLQEVRSLHYRTYLLAYRYDTRNLFQKQIRITPSKKGDYQLSDKAIPFYYAVGQASDLHRNWSFTKTITNSLNDVFSYHFMNMKQHPLWNSIDTHNFYRIEGIVGKGLGQVMKEVIGLKQQLGLSFAVEPVYVGLTMQNDLASMVMNQDALVMARQGLNRLLLCRFRDLDVVFLILMAFIFNYLYTIIALVSKFNTSTVAGLGNAGGVTPGAGVGHPGIPGMRVGTRIDQPFGLNIQPKFAEVALKEIRDSKYKVGAITDTLTVGETVKNSIGKFFTKIKKVKSTENMYDRTLNQVKKINPKWDPKDVTDKIYPSITLLDRAEELIDTASAASIADFDYVKFEARYDGFVKAFDTFVEHSVKLDLSKHPELAATRELLLQNYRAVATTGPQAIISNMVAEFRQRLENVFNELVLTGYSKRHPGMEHKGGVQEGGTLILLYTHKNYAAQLLKSHKSEIETRVKVVHAMSAAPMAMVNMKDPGLVLGTIPQAIEPLDDFIVIADFCVPYLCCDTDCSDIDLAPVSKSPQVKVTVVGTVYGEAKKAGVKPTVLKSARVTAKNLATGKAAKVKMKNGSYAFTAYTGTYLIAVKPSKIFHPAEQTLAIAPSKTPISQNFVLRRRL